MPINSVLAGLNAITGPVETCQNKTATAVGTQITLLGGATYRVTTNEPAYILLESAGPNVASNDYCWHVAAGQELVFTVDPTKLKASVLRSGGTNAAMAFSKVG